MPNSLGIYVTSDQHLDNLIHLVNAANRKDVEVHIFYTHLGCKLTQQKRFAELAGKARQAVCLVCFEKHKGELPVPGLGEKDFATQARHCDMIEECDRYMNM